MLDLFNAARQVSVPVLFIRTVDQAATAEAIRSASSPQFPVVQWDAARGITAVPNMAGEVDAKSKSAIDALKTTQDETVPFANAMRLAVKLPRGTVLLAHNAHRQLMSQEPLATAEHVQCIANLRDVLKQNFRMLVMLGPQFLAPKEIDHDIVVLDHPLPSPKELETVVTEMYGSAKLPAPKPDVLSKAVDAVSGLSLFAAEQQVAMSLKAETGVDLDMLWERKRVTIEQTRGLRVWRGTERFDDLVGLDSVKARLRKRLKARTPVGVVVFLDEIDKVLANVEHDTSGVRMDQMRTLLTEMENNNWRGMVCVGVPGGGKSAIAKAYGNEAGVPTVALDLGDMEGSLVGESEQMVRHAISIIKAIGRGNADIIATSNNMSVMRPELQRRFTEGMFFFDLMTPAERLATWKAYMKKYDLPAQKLPDDDGWTGAEIRNCCRSAWDNNDTLIESAKFIVPMALSRADEIERLRTSAHGKFLDATQPGTYKYESEPMQKMVRAIALPPVALEVIKEMKES